MYTIKTVYDDDLFLVVSYEEKVEESDFILKFKITESKSIPKEVFLFRKNMDNTDDFVAVCQPYMIDDNDQYPNARPVDGYGFYRKDEVELVYTSASEVLTNRITMQNDIETLVQDFGTIVNSFTTGSDVVPYEEDE
jgi:hypothetical protein